MTRSTAADRAAIEALARELDTETPAEWAKRVAPALPWDGPTIGDYVIGWVAVFDAWEHDDYRGVWWTSEECRALLAYLDEVWAGLTAPQRETLEHAGWHDWPALGRAVLRRAKERGV